MAIRAAANPSGVGEAAVPLTDSKKLVGFYTGSRPKAAITVAPRWRTWINEMHERWANRCLPLLVANEAGWTLLNPVPFTATWSGGIRRDAVEIEFEGGKPLSPLVGSHFGYGIITWEVPFLFRTPPGYNLLARGPANWPKDGVCALEGLVETDWSIATFTMNWKLTRPDLPVSFNEGEPFCMIVPQKRGELASFAPEIRGLATDAELDEAARAWAQRRHEMAVRKFLGEYARDFAEEALEWERHYFKGLRPDGTPAPAHETQLRLPDFVSVDGSDAKPDL